MWEDPACKNGGRFTLYIQKQFSNKQWEDLLLAMIGEQFPDENEILGIECAIKNKNDKLSVWNRTGNDEGIQSRIRETMMKLLGLPASFKIEYQQFGKDSDPKPSKPFFRGRGGFRGARGAPTTAESWRK